MKKISAQSHFLSSRHRGKTYCLKITLALTCSRTMKEGAFVCCFSHNTCRFSDQIIVYAFQGTTTLQECMDLKFADSQYPLWRSKIQAFQYQSLISSVLKRYAYQFNIENKQHIPYFFNTICPKKSTKDVILG